MPDDLVAQLRPDLHLHHDRRTCWRVVPYGWGRPADRGGVGHLGFPVGEGAEELDLQAGGHLHEEGVDGLLSGGYLSPVGRLAG